jgi:hypothetical protein
MCRLAQGSQYDDRPDDEQNHTDKRLRRYGECDFFADFAPFES